MFNDDNNNNSNKRISNRLIITIIILLPPDILADEISWMNKQRHLWLNLFQLVSRSWVKGFVSAIRSAFHFTPTCATGSIWHWELPWNVFNVRRSFTGKDYELFIQLSGQFKNNFITTCVEAKTVWLYNSWWTTKQTWRKLTWRTNPPTTWRGV